MKLNKEELINYLEDKLNQDIKEIKVILKELKKVIKELKYEKR